MAELRTAWATRDQVPAFPDGIEPSPQEVDDALLAASGILYRFTGKRWPGIVADVVRPQRTDCGCGWIGVGGLGQAAAGVYPGAGGGGSQWRLPHHQRSGCHWISEVELPGWPVLTVTEVLRDGDLVPEDRYRLDDGRFLVYLPESDHALVRGWPCCQRVDRDVTQDETFQISYTWGGIPDPGGVRSAAVLARELVLASTPGAKGCRLPQRVQSVARQGVSYTLIDPLNLFDQGRTGLTEVDLWVASIGLGTKRRRSGVIDPHAVAMNGRKFRRNDWNPSS